MMRVIERCLRVGAKVAGTLLAVPVICGAAGVALAAVTVGAPIYGVYRLVRHIVRASGKLSTDSSDVATDVDVESDELRWDDVDTDAESDVQMYFRLPTPDEPRRLGSSSSQNSSTSSTFDVEDDPPPLPPRQPAVHHNHMHAFPTPAPGSPPPLPPKQPSHVFYNYTRRRPPSPSVDDDVMVTWLPPVHRIRATIESSRMSIYPPPVSASLDVRSPDVHDVRDLELVDDAARRRPPAVPPPSPRHHDAISTNVDSAVAETVSDEITHL